MLFKLPTLAVIGSFVLSGQAQLLLSMFGEAGCPSDEPHVTDFIQPFSSSANCFAMPGGASVVTSAQGCSSATFFTDTTCSTPILSLTLPAGANQCFSFPYGSIAFTCSSSFSKAAATSISVSRPA